MATKKTFSSLAEKLIDQSNEATLLVDFKKNQTQDFIHTGNYLFNAHLSGSLKKGLPTGEIVTFAGDPKTYKSGLAMNAMINLVFKEYTVYVFETEGSPLKTRIVKHALNTNYKYYGQWVKKLLSNQYGFFNTDNNYLSKDRKSINVEYLAGILKELVSVPQEMRDTPQIEFLASFIKALKENSKLDERNAKNLIKYDFVFFRLKMMIVIEKPETVEDVIEITNRILKDLLDERNKILLKKDAVYEPQKLYFVLDSYTGLNTRSQYENAEGEKGVKSDMGTFAKMGKALFNMISIRCEKLGIGWLNTAHIYEKDMGNFRQRTPSGGNGPLYMSSIIPMFSKTVEKDKETKERKGIKVTSHIFESRHAKMTSVMLYIPFEKCMNDYFGLEEYVGWHICGIDKGRYDEFIDLANEMMLKKLLSKDDFTTKIFTLDDFKKSLSKAKAEALDGHIEIMADNGWIETIEGGKFKFTKKLEKQFDKDGKYQKIVSTEEKPLMSVVLNPNSPKWVVKHLGKMIETKELYTHEVFTDEVIDKLDEVIKPLFQFGNDQSSIDDVLAAADKIAADSIDDFLI